MSNKIINETLKKLSEQTCGEIHLDALFKVICRDLESPFRPEDDKHKLDKREEKYMKLLHKTFCQYSTSEDIVVKKLIKDLKEHRCSKGDNCADREDCFGYAEEGNACSKDVVMTYIRESEGDSTIIFPDEFYDNSIINAMSIYISIDTNGCLSNKSYQIDIYEHNDDSDEIYVDLFEINKHELCFKEEKPKLTLEEWLFCKMVRNGWISRDLNGRLFFRIYKPSKVKSGKSWVIIPNKNIDYTEESIIVEIKDFFNLDFSFIKWEDEEPWSIEDLLKLERM